MANLGFLWTQLRVTEQLHPDEPMVRFAIEFNGFACPVGFELDAGGAPRRGEDEDASLSGEDVSDESDEGGAPRSASGGNSSTSHHGDRTNLAAHPVPNSGQRVRLSFAGLRVLCGRDDPRAAATVASALAAASSSAHRGGRNLGDQDLGGQAWVELGLRARLEWLGDASRSVAPEGAAVPPPLIIDLGLLPDTTAGDAARGRKRWRRRWGGAVRGGGSGEGGPGGWAVLGAVGALQRLLREGELGANASSKDERKGGLMGGGLCGVVGLAELAAWQDLAFAIPPCEGDLRRCPSAGGSGCGGGNSATPRDPVSLAEETVAAAAVAATTQVGHAVRKSLPQQPLTPQHLPAAGPCLDGFMLHAALVVEVVGRRPSSSSSFSSSSSSSSTNTMEPLETLSCVRVPCSLPATLLQAVLAPPPDPQHQEGAFEGSGASTACPALAAAVLAEAMARGSGSVAQAATAESSPLPPGPRWFATVGEALAFAAGSPRMGDRSADESNSSAEGACWSHAPVLVAWRGGGALVAPRLSAEAVRSWRPSEAVHILDPVLAGAVGRSLARAAEPKSTKAAKANSGDAASREDHFGCDAVENAVAFALGQKQGASALPAASSSVRGCSLGLHPCAVATMAATTPSLAIDLWSLAAAVGWEPSSSAACRSSVGASQAKRRQVQRHSFAKMGANDADGSARGSAAVRAGCVGARALASLHWGCLDACLPARAAELAKKRHAENHAAPARRGTGKRRGAAAAAEAAAEAATAASLGIGSRLLALEAEEAECAGAGRRGTGSSPHSSSVAIPLPLRLFLGAGALLPPLWPHGGSEAWAPPLCSVPLATGFSCFRKSRQLLEDTSTPSTALVALLQSVLSGQALLPSARSGGGLRLLHVPASPASGRSGASESGVSAELACTVATLAGAAFLSAKGPAAAAALEHWLCAHAASAAATTDFQGSSGATLFLAVGMWQGEARGKPDDNEDEDAGASDDGSDSDGDAARADDFSGGFGVDGDFADDGAAYFGIDKDAGGMDDDDDQGKDDDGESSSSFEGDDDDDGTSTFSRSGLPLLLVPVAVRVELKNDGTEDEGAAPGRKAITISACGRIFLNPVLVADVSSIAAVAARDCGDSTMVGALRSFLASGHAAPTACLLGAPSSHSLERDHRRSSSSSAARLPAPLAAPPPFSSLCDSAASGGEGGGALAALADLTASGSRAAAWLALAGRGAPPLSDDGDHLAAADRGTRGGDAGLAEAAAAAVLGLSGGQRAVLASIVSTRGPPQAPARGSPQASAAGPALVAVCGLPGSGRTTALLGAALAATLAPYTPLPLLQLQQAAKGASKALSSSSSASNAGDAGGVAGNVTLASLCGGACLVVGPRHASLVAASAKLDAAVARPLGFPASRHGGGQGGGGGGGGGGSFGSESLCLVLSHDDDARVMAQVADLVAALALAAPPAPAPSSSATAAATISAEGPLHREARALASAARDLALLRRAMDAALLQQQSLGRDSASDGASSSVQAASSSGKTTGLLALSRLEAAAATEARAAQALVAAATAHRRATIFAAATTARDAGPAASTLAALPAENGSDKQATEAAVEAAVEAWARGALGAALEAVKAFARRHGNVALTPVAVKAALSRGSAGTAGGADFSVEAFEAAAAGGSGPSAQSPTAAGAVRVAGPCLRVAWFSLERTSGNVRACTNGLNFTSAYAMISGLLP